MKSIGKHIEDASEWWAPGVLKPSQAIEYPEMKAWRAARIAEGARVLTAAEWDALHPELSL